MNLDELEAAFGRVNFQARFNTRPSQIPGDLRLGWRLALLCLVLNRCYGRVASLEQVHLLVWAAKSSEGSALVERWFNGNRRPDEIVVRFDPTLTRTVTLAIGSQLVERRPQHRFALMDAGVGLVEAIYNDTDLMANEKAFLGRLPRRITQRSIRELTEWR